MAKAKSNLLLDGISTKVGGSLVFRQVAGKTVIAKAPDMSRRTVSPAQKKHLDKFQRLFFVPNRVWDGSSAPNYACFALRPKLYLGRNQQTKLRFVKMSHSQ